MEIFSDYSQSLFDKVCQRRGVFSNQFLLKLVKCEEVVHKYLNGEFWEAENLLYNLVLKRVLTFKVLVPYVVPEFTGIVSGR